MVSIGNAALVLILMMTYARTSLLIKFTKLLVLQTVASELFARFYQDASVVDADALNYASGWR